MQIKIKYHDPELARMSVERHGDWIDLRAAENVRLQAGEFKLISLGVSMKLPEGYEANIVPRSSTFKTWGILQANNFGVIDSDYCGENDVWKFPALAFRPTTINQGDRICQFRIVKKMEPVEFVEVDAMEDPSRGGFGSTGAQ